MRLIAAFALALIGLGMCLWLGNWFGFALIAAGLVLCPSEDEEQARVRRTTIAYRRGRMDLPVGGRADRRIAGCRASRGNSDWFGFDCRL